VAHAAIALDLADSVLARVDLARDLVARDLVALVQAADHHCPSSKRLIKTATESFRRMKSKRPLRR
jgi:hypothetical protein